MSNQIHSGKINSIVAHDDKRGIGKKNSLMWHLPSDLRRFRNLTTGHVVVMGRKTFESLPANVRPLPNRVNIIVTRDTDYQSSGAIITHSIKEAIDTAKKHDSEIFIIGGAEIYAQVLPLVDRLYVTHVSGDFGADAFFPEYEKEFTHVVSQENGEEAGHRYTFKILER